MITGAARAQGEADELVPALPPPLPAQGSLAMTRLAVEEESEEGGALWDSGCVSQIHEAAWAWGEPCGTCAVSPASLVWA